MPISQLTIVNSALIKVGAQRIQAIDEDNKQARIMNEIWETSVFAVLRSHKWNCATKRAALMPTGVPPAFGWDFAYDLPNDYLREVSLSESNIKYEVEDGQLLCNEETINLKYIYKNVNYSDYDPLLAEAISWYLAWQSAYAITQSASQVQRCEDGFNKSLAVARSMDAAEGSGIELEVDDWTSARL